ncbi:YjcZ family sporulation protein [Paenibacillus pasadenensis]|nr:YjcZ family sporulation protein [Paenibacillus pasadenensis]MCM3747162.1 YjcZ family sporulation protein [Paenibacillus pasadenensis]
MSFAGFGAGYNSTAMILVLFILLVIIVQVFCF